MAGKYTLKYADAAKGTFDVFPHEINGSSDLKDWALFDVIAGTAGTGAFIIKGNFSERFTSGFVFNISGSTGNDNPYTTVVAGSTYNSVTNITTIVVDEAVPDATTDGTLQYIVENTTSLLLAGRGTVNYGSLLLENLVQMLENFSDSIAPPNPTSGQLWFQSDISSLWVYDGTDWIGSGSIVTGTVAPTAPVAGMTWYDTNGPQLKVYDGVAFVSVADLYLPLSGGLLVGDVTLDAGTNLVFNGDAFTVSGATLFDVVATDINVSGTTVDILSTGLNDYVNITAMGNNAGVQFSVGGSVDTLIIEPNGVLKMPNLLNYVSLINDDDHIVNKKYVDDSAFLKLSGGIMLGDIVLVGDPTAALHPVSKQYIEANFIASVGGTLSGDLNMDNVARVVNVQDPTAAQDVSTKAYVDNKFVKLVGDTFTGPLILAADPVVALEASTKQYTDAAIDTVAWGVVSINSGASPYAVTDAVNLLVVDATGANVVVDLSAVAGTRVQPLIVKKTDNSANTITIVANGGDTIDGAPSVALVSQWDDVTIMDVGTEWLIIS